MTQIVMPHWSSGRVALLGDACGALTLLAGQGSHMAMAGAYLLARELNANPSDHQSAFGNYEALLKPIIANKQRSAARLANYIVPSTHSWPLLRRLVMRTIFNPLVLGQALRFVGSKSALSGVP